MNKPMSLQRARELALFRYSNALERGDFEVIAQVLKQAERDPILENMIAEMEAQTELPAEQPQATTRIVHKSGGIQQIITIRPPSPDGQTPDSDLSEEDRTMYSATQEDELFQPYLRPPVTGVRWLTLAVAVLIVVIMAALTVIVFRGGQVGNPLLGGNQPTPTPTATPALPLITSENIDQLEIKDIFGYGTIVALDWLPEGDKLMFVTSSDVIGFLNPSSLRPDPEIFQRQNLDQGLTSGPNASHIAISSPDGKTLAVADTQNTVTLWDIVTGEQRTSFTGRALRSLVFSSDGRLLAGGTASGEIRLWNAQTGEEVAEWPKFGSLPINSVAFSPDDAQLAAAYTDHSVRLWDVATGEVLGTFASHKDVVNTVAFSPDGNTIASGGKDGMVWLWDWREALGTQPAPLQRRGESISKLVFSPDGTTLAAASDDKTIHIWDVVNVTKRGVLKGHTDRIRDITFSPDGKQLASASMDETVRLWTVATLAEAQNVVLTGVDANWIWDMDFNSDQTLLASPGEPGTTILWDVATGNKLKVLEGHTDPVIGLRFSPDGSLLATRGNSTKDFTMILWDVASGEQKQVFDCSGLWHPDFSPDGKLLACAGGVGENAFIFDVASGEKIATLTGHTGFWGGVLFSPDGTLLASTGEDGGGLRRPRRRPRPRRAATRAQVTRRSSVPTDPC